MDDRRRITKEKLEEEEEEETFNRLFGFQVPALNNINNNNNSGSFYQSSRRLTTNPSSESIFTQNPYSNPSLEETLFMDHHHHHQVDQQAQAHAAIEDALSRLTLSPNDSSYRHRVEPPPCVDVFGNPINSNFYHLGGSHHHPNGFTTSVNPTYQSNIQPAIDYQRRLGYPEDLLVQQLIRPGCVAAAASQMNQGLDGSFPRRLNNNDSVLHDHYWRLLNGGGMNRCGCGNPLCPIDYPQSALVLAEQFRRGGASLSNTNGHRQNYAGGNGGNRSRRGSSVPVNEWERNFDLSRSMANNRNRLEQQYTGLPLAECRRRIVALAQDQNGCRYLQTFFEEGKLDDIRVIFTEIKDHVGKLMMDPFGNYLVQKMFEVCSQEQLTQLILSVTRDQYEFVHIAMDIHGNCCVQKLLQLITTPEQISLVMSALGPGAVMMTRETNGHHVLNLCLKNFTNDDIKYILNMVAENCVDIATDKSGCCILQQFLEHTLGDYRERLVSEITAHSLLLAQDPYGNYVVQYLLQQRIHRITDDILRQLKGNFVSLSMQKFSSNVVQRCLNESVEERSVEIIRELIDSPKILMLFQDQFANYVIQTALEVSKAREHIFNAIADLIRMNYQSLRSHPFGKRIISKMNELSRRDRI